MKPVPVTREVAPRRAAVWSNYIAGDDTPADFLRAAGAPYRGRAGLYRLFEEMEDKDAHLFSVLQTRKNGVLCRPRSLEPATQDDAGRAVAAFVEETLAAIPDFEGALQGALDAVGKGLSVSEVMWERRGGALRVAEIRQRFAGRFRFDEAGRLRLADGPTGVADAGVPVPERKFLTMRFGRRPGDPYGQGLCEKAYWYYWFRKNNLKFWISYNERFGSPTVVATYRPGTPAEERERLMEVIDSVRHDAGVAIPEGVAIELLEAQRGGSASTYRELADWCNDEISKLVLGQTLTTSEGRRSGSLALGEVHEVVRNEYVESDARLLMAVVNDQLIRWIVDFNFGPATPAPRWRIDTSRDEDLGEQVEVDRRLVSMGVPLSTEYFHRRYGRPAPAPGERALVFDDRNFYQYHLQYGVLTVNEVRRALGLPPVAWGERPTAAPDGGGDHGGRAAASRREDATGTAGVDEPTEEDGDKDERRAER